MDGEDVPADLLLDGALRRGRRPEARVRIGWPGSASSVLQDSTSDGGATQWISKVRYRRARGAERRPISIRSAAASHITPPTTVSPAYAWARRAAPAGTLSGGTLNTGRPQDLGNSSLGRRFERVARKVTLGRPGRRGRRGGGECHQGIGAPAQRVLRQGADEGPQLYRQRHRGLNPRGGIHDGRGHSDRGGQFPRGP